MRYPNSEVPIMRLRRTENTRNAICRCDARARTRRASFGRGWLSDKERQSLEARLARSPCVRAAILVLKVVDGTLLAGAHGPRGDDAVNLFQLCGACDSNARQSAQIICVQERGRFMGSA